MEKHFKWIVILISLILLFLIYALNLNYKNDEIFLLGFYVHDIKNLLIGLIIGLFFSILLTIETIRNYLLDTISNFLTHSSYIRRSDKQELLKLQNEITETIHGMDIVTNKESLFNSIKRFDKILTIPHKSIVNESWVLTNMDKGQVLIARTQNYRIHKLTNIDSNSQDNKNNFFNLKFRYSIKTEEEYLSIITENFIMDIQVEGATIHSINKDNIENYEIENGNMEKGFNPEKKIYHFYFDCNIPLEKEFTKIKVFTQRVEPQDDSIALVVTDATYCSNYSFKLPENIKINNIYTQETLIPSNVKQVDIASNNNHISININGWQLPGLLFVITFDKN